MVTMALSIIFDKGCNPMPVSRWIKMAFHRLINQFYSRWPQPIPARKRFEDVHIISHRGEHDNLSLIENTIPAFDRVRDEGVWGIELDIQWTLDHQPVVFHDTTGRRLFDSEAEIRLLSLSELQTDFPLIPSLEEVIDRYGGSLHLMIELKKETFPDSPRHIRQLKDLLSPLSPQRDYHLLSLNEPLFDRIDFLPSQTFIPIAELNFRHLSAVALRKHYGGITGHYLFLNNTLLQTHHRQGQQTGTGFIESENCLYREINRGVDWVFTNQAVKLQRIWEKKRVADGNFAEASLKN